MLFFKQEKMINGMLKNSLKKNTDKIKNKIILRWIEIISLLHLDMVYKDSTGH